MLIILTLFNRDLVDYTTTIKSNDWCRVALLGLLGDGDLLDAMQTYRWNQLLMLGTERIPSVVGEGITKNIDSRDN